MQGETPWINHEEMENKKDKAKAEAQVVGLCDLLGLFALKKLKGWCAPHMNLAEWGKQMEACSGHIP